MKKIQHLLEAAATALLFKAFRLLPLDMASYLGGLMARGIGPFLKAHRIARQNLSMVFADYSDVQIRRIQMDMWDHLGRNIAEFANLSRPRLLERLQSHGLENIPVNGQPAIFFSGHIGNWDLAYPMVFHHNVPVTLIYRHANNPYVDRMILDLRAYHSADSIPKGPKGAVRLGRVLKEKRSLAMLVDQKMNQGVAVPFFGREAMTAPAVAELALRYGMLLIPIRVIRTKGCHFNGYVYPPLTYTKTGDKQADELAILTQINQLLEGWIREYPAQWFWVHQRWPRN